MPKAHVLTIKDPFRFEVEFRLAAIESFIQISLAASQEFARRSKRDLEGQIARAIEENKSAVPVAAIPFQRVGDYMRDLCETVPHYLGYSFVMNVYNLFEDLGKSLYKKLIGREMKITRSDGFLTAFEKFTEQEAITFVECSPLREFKEVRNNIVHQGGKLAGESKEKRDTLLRIVDTNSTTLSISDDGQIQVAAEYAIENFKLIRQFFLNALDQKKFEDGLSWSKIPETFGVSVGEGKVTIAIKGSTTESKTLPLTFPLPIVISIDDDNLAHRDFDIEVQEEDE